MSPPKRITAAILTEWEGTDAELGRHLGVTRSAVSQMRRALGIPSPRVQPPMRTLANGVLRVASTGGRSTDAVIRELAAIVERMERVQGRMAALMEPTDYIGSP